MNRSVASPSSAAPPFTIRRGFRTVIGGLLMGIANLIPGVSGGTMILAIGIYEDFIEAVADLTALRFSVRRIVFLGILALFAGCAILGLSSVILHLLLWHSVAMFAFFIGLTLGGAPLLVKMIGRPTTGAVVATLAGFALMAVVAGAKYMGDMSVPQNTAMDFTAGVVGATTMVLPGISGSYMLLILDQYDRVIGSISDLRSGSLAALKIIIPVGIGAALGIIGLSNLLKWLLRRHEKATLGFLLGMLLGSVLGLWPFTQKPTMKILERSADAQLQQFAEQEGVAGTAGLHDQALHEYILAQWDKRTVNLYAGRRIATAGVMLAAGLAISILLGRLGGTPASAAAKEDPASKQVY